MKFNTLKLKDVACEDKKSIISGPFGSDISSKFFQEDGVPVIRGNNLSNNAAIKFKDEGFAYLTEEKANELNAYAIKNDLIFTAAGTIGQVGLIEEKAKYSKYVISNKQIRVRLNLKKINPFYAYYWFSSPWVVKDIVNKNTGSTVPLINLTIIRDLEIKMPLERFYQDKIASVLSFLDSKIELNNRINAELEAMAKTLYDYWFVQFDFPDTNGKPYKTSGGKMVWNEELKREVPEGWEVKKLGDLGNFKNGVNYDPSNPGDIACPIINVRNISASSYFLKNEDLDIIYLRESDVRKYAVHDGSIIIARSGIPGATRLISDIEENTLYCGFAIHYELTNLDYKIPIFFYLKSIEQQIQNGSGGTILKNVNQGTLNALQIALATDNLVIAKFNELIQPIFSKINLIQKENQKLTELRDWLLPMLMNGQVKVN